MKPLLACVPILIVATFTAPAAAQSPDGAAVFQTACASCHAQPAADSRAPNRDALGQLAPETILTALTTGNMFRQGSALSDAERRAVSAFVAGRPVGAPAPPSTVGRCASTPPPLRAADLASGWNGWAPARRTRVSSRPTKAA